MGDDAVNRATRQYFRTTRFYRCLVCQIGIVMLKNSGEPKLRTRHLATIESCQLGESKGRCFHVAGAVA